MSLGTAVSKNGVTIRLTDERWLHIITSHKEIDPLDFERVLNAIENPDIVFSGDTGELLAVKKIPGSSKWFVVVYKERSKTDGFVLTTYMTTDYRWLFKRRVIWSKKS